MKVTAISFAMQPVRLSELFVVCVSVG